MYLFLDNYLDQSNANYVVNNLKLIKIKQQSTTEEMTQTLRVAPQTFNINQRLLGIFLTK